MAGHSTLNPALTQACRQVGRTGRRAAEGGGDEAQARLLALEVVHRAHPHLAQGARSEQLAQLHHLHRLR